MEDQTRLDELFVTLVRFPEDKLIGVERLCETIKQKDSSFHWETRKINNQWTLLVYSASKNQAKQRGEWLTAQTPILQGLTYETTHRITLETALRERPREVLGLREYLKRKREGL